MGMCDLGSVRLSINWATAAVDCTLVDGPKRRKTWREKAMPKVKSARSSAHVSSS